MYFVKLCIQYLQLSHVMVAYVEESVFDDTSSFLPDPSHPALALLEQVARSLAAVDLVAL